MPKDSKHFGPPPIDKIWLKEQFDKLHSEHALILKKIDIVPKFVTPQVATAIRNLIVQTKIVDDKVPDKNVPPGSTTPH